jgi:hypothetical protein
MVGFLAEFVWKLKFPDKSIVFWIRRSQGAAVWNIEEV